MNRRPTRRKRRREKNRISIGLNEQEQDALDRALLVRYGEEASTRLSRGTFLRLAVFAYSSAVARLGKDYFCGMLACDVRNEAPDECAARNGKPQQQQLALPDNIVALFG